MVEFNRKKTYKKFLYSPLTLFILFILFLVMLKAIWGVYAKEQMSARSLEREMAEYSKMVAREKELAQAVEYLKTEKGVETEIRSKFRVVKEGESVAVIVDNDDKAVPVATTTPKKGFWKRIFGL